MFIRVFWTIYSPQLEVPYASIQECGNYQNHNLELVQKVARRLLSAQSSWLEVI